MYGTDDGIYLSDFRERNRDPVKVLGLREVLQVDVLEDYQLLVVLSGRAVTLHYRTCLQLFFPLQNVKLSPSLSMPSITWTLLRG